MRPYFKFIAALLIFFAAASSIYSSNTEEIKKYDGFSLYDYDNRFHSLEDFTTKKGIVLIFISTQCPVSNAYNKRMAELHNDFKSDFDFVGLNSNKQEDILEIKEHAEENGLQFIILKDSSNIIADKFNASFTPEVYVLNNEFVQLYHGRIDDSRRESDIEVSDLRNALNEIKEGKQVSIKKTKAFGCTIKRVD